jgi:hypothetical protein
MRNYIVAYCKARGIEFGQPLGRKVDLILCVPKYAVIETDIMPVVSVVLQDRDLSKILISLDEYLRVWQL